MNVYNDFYAGITPDQWEWFAADFLIDIGYELVSTPSRGPDGGKDLTVGRNGVTYLVSCKHFLLSNKTVGRGDEESILERMVEHSATGFIGFYSTYLSTGLQNRLDALNNAGTPVIVYENNAISNHLPHIHSFVLQKYGLPNNIKYCMNVSVYDYKTLPCINCSKDIIEDQNISASMALVYLNDSQELEYVYGCKACFGGYPELGWTELNQSLHPEQLNGWIRYVDDLLDQYPGSSNLHLNRGMYERRVLQRAYPSNWGQWLRL